jgi:hypothetical protein
MSLAGLILRAFRQEFQKNHNVDSRHDNDCCRLRPRMLLRISSRPFTAARNR